MFGQERRNQRVNQFMQENRTFDYLQQKATQELNKLTPEIKDKDESESTCHSERRSRWETNEPRLRTCSRKTRNFRAVYRERPGRNLNKQYEVFKSISPSNSDCQSNQLSNDNDSKEQNLRLREMLDFRDLGNEECMIKIIKEKFTQIVKDFKDKNLRNSHRATIIENFLLLKERYAKNDSQLDLIITDFFQKNIKDINDIFSQLELCYNKTIKSPEFIENLFEPISDLIEEKNISINFENLLKEEFFNVILNDLFFKEIIQEIENRDLIILTKIKTLIRGIKEEFCIHHSSHCINHANNKKNSKNCVQQKAEVPCSANGSSNSVTYSKMTINSSKKGREGKICSPVKENLPAANPESEYKSINDLVEYINSESGKTKKNKKKNVSKKKKQNVKKPAAKPSTSRNKESTITSSRVTPTAEIDNEIEEFRRRIMMNSKKANQVQKIKPKYSEVWLLGLKSQLDC